MSVEEGLVAELRDDAGVTAIVGTRIYPEAIPQKDGTMPAIVYQRLISLRDRELAGTTDLINVRVRVDCWDTSYSGCKALADAVRLALNDERVALGSFVVQDVFLDTEGDLSEFDGDDSDYRVSQEYEISYVEV